MKTVKLTLVLILFMVTNACSQQANLNQVKFLIGTWKMEGKESYENWEKSENILVGKSFKIKDGQKKVSETLEIIIQNNQIIYVPTVFNQNDGKSIPFVLESNKENLFSFENPKHDFPKKIQYKIVNDNELYVSVLGDNDQGFSYKLIKQHTD